MEDLSRSWAVHLNRGWCANVVYKVSWISPPTGILKLNFDGSFFQQIQMGGIGGVFCDFNGKVKSFSGPANSSDSNDSEVYAILAGCHELQKLGCYNAIIEGDSFSAI